MQKFNRLQVGDETDLRFSSPLRNNNRSSGPFLTISLTLCRLYVGYEEGIALFLRLNAFEPGAFLVIR